MHTSLLSPELYTTPGGLGVIKQCMFEDGPIKGWIDVDRAGIEQDCRPAGLSYLNLRHFHLVIPTHSRV